MVLQIPNHVKFILFAFLSFAIVFSISTNGIAIVSSGQQIFLKELELEMESLILAIEREWLKQLKM